MRSNTYKKHILQVLQNHHLLTMADLHSRVSDADYSTIYRNVEQLVKDGQVKRVVLDKNDTRYELAHADHDHDHFVCTDCGDVQSLPSTFRDTVPPQLAKCSISDLLVKGRCEDCNA